MGSETSSRELLVFSSRSPRDSQRIPTPSTAHEAHWILAVGSRANSTYENRLFIFLCRLCVRRRLSGSSGAGGYLATPLPHRPLHRTARPPRHPPDTFRKGEQIKKNNLKLNSDPSDSDRSEFNLISAGADGPPWHESMYIF